MGKKDIKTNIDKLNDKLKEDAENIEQATEKIRKISEKLDKFDRISTIVFLIVLPIMWIVNAINLSKGTLSLYSYIITLVFTLCVIVDVYSTAKRKNTSVNISIENIDGVKVENTNI